MNVNECESLQPGSFDVIITSQHAMYTVRDTVMVNPSIYLSVRLSVCLSVCPSVDCL